ncbi:P-loop NTPase fold protein [Microbacterium sp. NPDC091662]|uniref:KAP family P-loop NTPase fold protein n=1 Tax=Microbacterium sp. NPDC091662 TaxID=3364211 RepID=UPI003824442F
MPDNQSQRLHWSDAPLDVDADDSLGRSSFVATVVRRIQLATADDPSTVFGLVGAWGSGKTSILKRIRIGLADDWIVADFTPWSSGDAASMSLEFVTTLIDALGLELKGAKGRKLLGYAAYAAPLLGAIPLVGAGVKGSADQVLKQLASRPPWHKQFDELSAQIQELGKRVLIVVDDVDRLGGDELLTLLKVLRLLGRFRGVHYLIAYDQDTVEDLLRSTGSVGRSASFMEKIVQYPFETPPIPRAVATRLVRESIEALLAETDLQLDEGSLHRASSLINIVGPMIETPRTLGRFRQHLLAFGPHVVEGQLDLLDYVAVTWLRLSAHGVWAKLGQWHELLRTGSRPTGILESEEVTEAEWELSVSQADPSANVRGTTSLLAVMFPGVKTRGYESYVEHPRSIADRTYFGRYMLLAIPEDDVSDELIADVIYERGGPSRAAELSVIIDGPNDDLADLAISRYEALRSADRSPSLRLATYLAERLATRGGESETLAAPHGRLRVVLAREIALALIGRTMDVPSVVSLLGEKRALDLVWLVVRPLFAREHRDELIRMFADYWFGQLPERIAELRAAGLLADVMEVVLAGRPHDDIAGLLDADVANFDDYVRLAETFVRFAEWVGSAVTYEMSFADKQFAIVLSESVHAGFAPRIKEESGQLTYERDDHPSRDIDPRIVRAFTIDSLAAMSFKD